MIVPRVEVLASIDSTQAEARRRIEAGTAVTGLVLQAHEQTAGRGSRGRTWVTVPGRSLALSVVLPLPDVPRISRVTLWTAVCACRALESAGSPPLAIKWPNDVMRGEGKLGGVLVEAARGPGGAERLVVGLGLNLDLSEAPRVGDLPEAATDAGLPSSLAAGVREAIVAELLEVWAAPGGPLDRELGEDYVRRSWLDGRKVSLVYSGTKQAVTVSSVTEEADLVLADGRVLRGEHVQRLDMPKGAP